MQNYKKQIDLLTFPLSIYSSIYQSIHPVEGGNQTNSDSDQASPASCTSCSMDKSSSLPTTTSLEDEQMQSMLSIVTTIIVSLVTICGVFYFFIRRPKLSQQAQGKVKLTNHEASEKNTMTTSEDIKKAKQELRTILAQNYYDTKNEKVVEAVDNLSSLWKESDEFKEQNGAPAKSDLIYGDWQILSAPQFPDRIIHQDKPNTYQYTLGRMTFNMFEPKKTPATIKHPGILNAVHKIDTQPPFDSEAENHTTKATYNVLNKIIIHAEGGDLPAELFLEGYCTPKNDIRLTVGFTAGTLRKPQEVEKDEKLSKLWNQTFDGIYAKSDQQRTYVEGALRYLMKSMLKMTLPSDESMRYEMKRVMHGYLDILYLDGELRITRGNRGSLVIVERQPN